MRNAKVLVALALAAVAAIVYVATRLTATEAPDANATQQRRSIGIFQVVRHPALDAMTAQFTRELKRLLPAGVDFTTMVPEGDATKTEQMAQRFAVEGYDLVFAVGTNLAQSLARKTNTMPIVLGAATDPKAAGLVDSWERPGRNITGTSDLSPVENQIQRLIEIMPEAKRIGIIYNPAEENSGIIVDRFKVHCAGMGLESVTATISGQNEMRQTVVSLLGRIDALYVPTDATVQSAFPALIGAADELKIPVFDCEEGSVKQGAVFSVGFDYEELGAISAEMAADILLGKGTPAEMPIRRAKQFKLYYNLQEIAALNLALPEAWGKEGQDVTP